MAVDSQAFNKTIHNHGNNMWKTVPPATGGSGQFTMTIPKMPGPAKQVYGGIPFKQGELLNTVNARVVRNGNEIFLNRWINVYEALALAESNHDGCSCDVMRQIKMNKQELERVLLI